KTIEKKIKSAYCPIGTIEGNPVVDILRYVILPYYKEEITINRPSGNLKIASFETFKEAYEKQEIHPSDLKNAVSGILNEMVEPARKIIENTDLSFLK
ncbi:MAG: tyrosine--tRNA ligase, partial [Thermoplasmata archaeon]